MKKNLAYFFSVIFVLVLVVFGYFFLFSNQDNSGNTLADNLFGWQYPIVKFPTVGSSSGLLAYSDIRDPGGIPQGLPVRLLIPTIKVNSAIEDALITPGGRMDVPIGSRNVAWFALGPHPGEVGSAVIGGHFGIKNGEPFVFYDLDKLKAGDKVYIEDDKGQTLAFVVRKVALFDRNADSTTVFTSHDGLAHLNLITCEGAWNKVNGAYPDRRVVFTDLVPEESPISMNTSSKGSVKAKLPIAGVTTPQSPEETVPAEISPTLELPPSPLKSPLSVFSVKSAFATPLDGLVTSLLLVSLFLVAFKIKWKRKSQ